MILLRHKFVATEQQCFCALEIRYSRFFN